MAPTASTPTALAADLDTAWCRCCAANGCECQATDVALDGPDAIYVVCNCCLVGQCDCEGIDVAPTTR